MHFLCTGASGSQNEASAGRRMYLFFTCASALGSQNVGISCVLALLGCRMFAFSHVSGLLGRRLYAIPIVWCRRVVLHCRSMWVFAACDMQVMLVLSPADLI